MKKTMMNIFNKPKCIKNSSRWDAFTSTEKAFIVIVLILIGLYFIFYFTIVISGDTSHISLNETPNPRNEIFLNDSIVVAAHDSSDLSKSRAQYICDGVDDQNEIQTALNNAGKGEIVELTEGTFYTSGNIVIPGDCQLIGRGEEKTILYMTGWGDIYVSRSKRNVRFNAHIVVPNENVVLKKFTITEYGWIHISASNVQVEDVTVRDSFNQIQLGDWRIGSLAAFSIDLKNQNLQNITFNRCSALRVGTNGFKNDNMDDPNQNGDGRPKYWLENVSYINCKAVQCGSGIYTDPNQGSRANEIYACGFDVQEFIRIKGIMLQNCYAEDNWMDGIHFESNEAYDVRIISCRVTRNGQRKLAQWGLENAGRGIMGAVNAVITDCYSEENANAGYLQLEACNVHLENCVDNGSEYGFMCITRNRKDCINRYDYCVSENPLKKGFYISSELQCQVKNSQVKQGNSIVKVYGS